MAGRKFRADAVGCPCSLGWYIIEVTEIWAVIYFRLFVSGVVVADDAVSWWRRCSLSGMFGERDVVLDQFLELLYIVPELL